MNLTMFFDRKITPIEKVLNGNSEVQKELKINYPVFEERKREKKNESSKYPL